MPDNYDDEGFCRDCMRRICVCPDDECTAVDEDNCAAHGWAKAPEQYIEVYVVVWHNYQWAVLTSVFDSLEKARKYVLNIGLESTQYKIQRSEVL